MRFSERDDGDGFVEIRIRMVKSNDECVLREVSGNEARKRLYSFVLSTASALCGNALGSAGDRQFAEIALAHMASADAEAQRWETLS